MDLFHFLIVVQAIIAAALVGIILMQQSEGGGLGMGGSPSGLMSARGAADFMTRTTTILAVLFVSLSIVLAVVASNKGAPTTIDDTFERRAPVAPVGDEIPIGTGQPTTVDPLEAAPPATGEQKSGDEVPLDR